MMGDSAYKSTLDCFVKTLKNDVSSFSAVSDVLFFTPLLEIYFVCSRVMLPKCLASVVEVGARKESQRRVSQIFCGPVLQNVPENLYLRRFEINTQV